MIRSSFCNRQTKFFNFNLYQQNIKKWLKKVIPILQVLKN